jgi:hypothetical protein
MAVLTRDTQSWLTTWNMLRQNVLSSASVVHLYCNGSAEVKEYHVLAAFWKEEPRSDDRSMPYASLDPCAMPIGAVQTSLPGIEDPSQTKIYDLINHDVEIGCLGGI